ncbi:MAG TPA: methyltransferase [Haliangiales bacterium]|nr:methyltransferase [Haliangiales bacterium]
MLARSDVEGWLDRLYIDAAGAGLRREDRKKAAEITALLAEVERAAARLPRDLVVVDAAAGKGYVGILAAKLVLDPMGRRARVIALERDPARVAAAVAAADRAGVHLEARTADVGGRAAWPSEPSLVVALHACGGAGDALLDAAIAARARTILVVPCCTPASAGADAAAEGLGLPRHAPVRRAFTEAFVAAVRTLRLEAAGYETEVVSFVAPTVTPYHLLWRARRVGEPVRSREAADRLARLLAHG